MIKAAVVTLAIMGLFPYILSAVARAERKIEEYSENDWR